MNLLSHAILTPTHMQDPGFLVGNLVADWVKGRARLALPEALRRGMATHARIDIFMDTHPLPAHCSDLLTPRWGRYSDVLVDIFFDHCLASRWSDYCDQPREAFIFATYAILKNHLPLLPQRAHYATCALLADDWFSTYSTLDGIALSLTRLSARLRHDIELAPAVDDFRQHAAAFHSAYAQFLPQVRTHIREDLNLAPQPSTLQS